MEARNEPAETRRAFVVWITREAAPAGGPRLEGRIEDVATGREVKFQSAAQLIDVIERCLASQRDA